MNTHDAVLQDDVQLRQLTTTDSIDELTTLLHRAYARLGAMGLNYTAVDQSPMVTAKRLGSGTCYVATQDGRLVGTILAHPTYATKDCAWFTRLGVACIHQFAVDPCLQGGGVGRRLLKRAEDWAREHGFTEVAMDTAEEATHLPPFCARLGYDVVDTVQWPGKAYRSVVLRKLLA